MEENGLNNVAPVTQKTQIVFQGALSTAHAILSIIRRANCLAHA